MTKIEPALNAEQWQWRESAIIRDVSVSAHGVLAIRDKVHEEIDLCEPIAVPAALLPATIALANALLPDGDPRKITRERAKALRKVIQAAASHWDKGPPDEGWQSDELISAVAICEVTLTALKSLLPPESER